jgi:excisionase family DNA binding protein
MEPEFIDINNLAVYLAVKPSTLYSLVEAGEIPHYKVGRLVRFKKAEIDLWMESHRKGCADDGNSPRRPLKSSKRTPVDADRIVKKAIDSARAERYNPAHGKPDRIKGLGKEVPDGTV